ncbi:MAG: helix-turn-helix transcriptional regulator [Anaerolineae bacterium]|nr:helix-turn-helix transcriptional regulator [Anaerolineae bacterium]
MISESAFLTRNKIIGVLVRQARLDANESVEACAAALGCDPARIVQAEEGEVGFTLPQLEGLARCLGVPVSRLLYAEPLPEEDRSAPFPYQQAMLIRAKIIGVMLREARQEAGQTLEQVAPSLGYTPERLGRIELGEEAISVVELEALCGLLGISLDALMAEELSFLPAEPEGDDAALDHLPPDVHAFVRKPINLPYLQLAISLSELPADALRQIAASLLQITY